MENPSFFASLPLLNSFVDVTVPANYRPLPDDWLIVLTDVRGSTKAIEQGRYRDVNVLGASGIVAVLNAVGDLEIPYVFGGDGATLAVPPEMRARVEGALKATQQLARVSFDLDLRAGIIPVRVLRERGADVQVARLKTGSSGGLAMFRGGGTGLAETLLKDTEEGREFRIELSADEEASGDFEGLQCRWDPIQAKSGVMISLLVLARSADPLEAENVYRMTVEQVSAIVGKSGGPVKREALEQQISSRWLRWGSHEVRVRTHGMNLWNKFKYQMSVLFQMLALRLMLAAKKTGENFDPEKYLTELPQATDFQKFDDLMRMILDCSNAQKQQIEALLEQLRAEKRIYYGLHFSDSALMTCLVFNWNHHLHLVDGSGGGYALAAVQLKAQIKADQPTAPATAPAIASAIAQTSKLDVPA